jgi:hypothetical protein
VKHTASVRFWALYEALPKPVRAVADKNFQLLKLDPKHPSLHFKRIGKVWSVRVGSITVRWATMLRMGSNGSGSGATLTMIESPDNNASVYRP